MGIAQKFNLPKIAILKCRKTKNCSLDHVFDIVDVRYEDAGSAFWLKLDTRGGDIGADVGEMDLSYLNKLPLQDPLSKDALSKVDSLKGSAEQLEATCEMARRCITPRYPGLMLSHIFTANMALIAGPRAFG